MPTSNRTTTYARIFRQLPRAAAMATFANAMWPQEEVDR